MFYWASEVECVSYGEGCEEVSGSVLIGSRDTFIYIYISVLAFSLLVVFILVPVLAVSNFYKFVHLSFVS